MRVTTDVLHEWLHDTAKYVPGDRVAVRKDGERGVVRKVTEQIGGGLDGQQVLVLDMEAGDQLMALGGEVEHLGSRDS
jgi:hypothetical protein